MAEIVLGTEGSCSIYNATGNRFLFGETAGKQARQFFKLDALDQTQEPVTVVIPEEVDWNVPFFRGLFTPSIRACGSSKAFFDRFQFQCSPEHSQRITELVSRIDYETRGFYRPVKAPPPLPDKPKLSAIKHLIKLNSTLSRWYKHEAGKLIQRESKILRKLREFPGDGDKAVRESLLRKAQGYRAEAECLRQKADSLTAPTRNAQAALAFLTRRPCPCNRELVDVHALTDHLFDSGIYASRFEAMTAAESYRAGFLRDQAQEQVKRLQDLHEAQTRLDKHQRLLQMEQSVLHHLQVQRDSCAHRVETLQAEVDQIAFEVKALKALFGRDTKQRTQPLSLIAEVTSGSKSNGVRE